MHPWAPHATHLVTYILHCVDRPMVMAKWSDTSPRGYVLTMLCSTKNGTIHYAVDGGDSVIYESDHKPAVTPPAVLGGTVSVEAWSAKVID